MSPLRIFIGILAATLITSAISCRGRRETQDADAILAEWSRDANPLSRAMTRHYRPVLETPGVIDSIRLRPVQKQVLYLETLSERGVPLLESDALTTLASLTMNILGYMRGWECAALMKGDTSSALREKAIAAAASLDSADLDAYAAVSAEATLAAVRGGHRPRLREATLASLAEKAYARVPEDTLDRLRAALDPDSAATAGSRDACWAIGRVLQAALELPEPDRGALIRGLFE